MNKKPPESLPCNLLSSATQYRLAVSGVLLLTAMLCLLAVRRRFDHDEFEAIKSAWKILQGERIYVDFFQHHHPMLYYLLAPLIRVFGETREAVLAARGLSLAFTMGILATTYAIARELFDRYAAVAAVLFLLAMPLFVATCFEVRPDVPQTLFGLLSVYWLIRFLRDGRRADLLLSALSLGMAFLFLQKAILLAGLVAGLLGWRLLQARLALRELLLYLAVPVAMWALYAGYLAATGQLHAYLFFNFAFNAGKTDWHSYPVEMLKSNAVKANLFVLLCFGGGLLAGRTREQRETGALAAGLLSLAAVYPTQYPQYYLMSLPLVAVVAAGGWIGMYRRLPLPGLLLLALILLTPAAGYLHDLRYRGNGTQLATIDYVTRMTERHDYVYDGDIQFNLFRRDLDFFWFSVGDGKGLSAYRRLRGRYDYDVYALIERYRPRIISAYAVDVQDPRIRDHYIRSREFGTLYLRKG